MKEKEMGGFSSLVLYSKNFFFRKKESIYQNFSYFIGAKEKNSKWNL